MQCKNKATTQSLRTHEHLQRRKIFTDRERGGSGDRKSNFEQEIVTI